MGPGSEVEGSKKRVGASARRRLPPERPFLSALPLWASCLATFLTPRDGALTPDTYIDITHENLRGSRLGVRRTRGEDSGEYPHLPDRK